MNYLGLLTSHNLALVSYWLEETGELYVDVYWPHSAGGSGAYIVRSLGDLRALLINQKWREIEVNIFRGLQFPLRGIANEKLLDLAYQQISDGQAFDVINLTFYPHYITFCGGGKSHTELRRDLLEASGDLVGIGREPQCLYRSPFCGTEEMLRLSFGLTNGWDNNEFKIGRNQDYYPPYANHPERYKWIKELWGTHQNDYFSDTK
ncbi:MAG TPA: hypothetical protein VKQ72_08895 [Aggregatilineales bacterium]|nr:hypothetical protein [Aggregatilineales bacterium]